MLKSIALSMLLAGVSCAALAQTMTTPAPGGATGTTATKDVGSTTPNVGQTGNGATSSSSMEMQRIKQNSAMGAPQQGYNRNADYGTARGRMAGDTTMAGGSPMNERQMTECLNNAAAQGQPIASCRR